MKSKSRRQRINPEEESKKISVHARFSPEVIAFFKAKGPDWKKRIEKALMAFVEAAR